MSFSDPVADMLTRIRNAQMVKHAKVVLPHSNFKASICQLLAAEGYIDGYEETALEHGKKNLTVTLRYYRGQGAIIKSRRVSRPGLRRYVPADALPRVNDGLGIAVISTSRGVMTDDQARRAGLGGEVVCEVF